MPRPFLSSESVEKRTKHYFAGLGKRQLGFFSEDALRNFLCLSEEERAQFSEQGDGQKHAILALTHFEKEMFAFEKNEQVAAMKRRTVRLLSNTGSGHEQVPEANRGPAKEFWRVEQ